MAMPARMSFAPFRDYRYRLAVWVQAQKLCQCQRPHYRPQRWGWWLVLTAPAPVPAPVHVALRDWVVRGRRHRACRRRDALLRRARGSSGARITSRCLQTRLQWQT